jgi:hypothetical protein
LISLRGKTSTLLYPSSSAKEELDRKTYDACPGAPEPVDKAKFTTHGLAMRAVRNSIYTLFAVHHGKRESVEVFQVDDFTVLDNGPAESLAQFRELLLGMSYGDSGVRRLLDLEGLKTASRPQ